MKMGIKILSGGFVLAMLSYLLFGTNIGTATGQSNHASDSILVKTKWKQMGGFEKYTPDHLRLGCWSTALAQLMYYHRLKPFGKVAYTSRNGYVIDADIDSSQIDLGLMGNTIDSTTARPIVDAMAIYNYYAALAVRKDFGTDRYMNKLAPASLFEQHYKVKSKRYISWRRTLPYSFGKLKKVIRTELDARRPLLLHFSDLKGFGHSVVIDAYKLEKGRLLLHLNQGQGGPQDGWYDFDGPILKAGDERLRVIYSFLPSD